MSTTYDLQVITHSSHVRSKPEYKADGSNVVGYVQNGEKFTATKVQNGWYYVPKENGWIRDGSGSAKYLKVLKTNTTPVTPPVTKVQEKVKVETKKVETKLPEPKPSGPSGEMIFLSQALASPVGFDKSGIADNNLVTLSGMKNASSAVTSTYNVVTPGYGNMSASSDYLVKNTTDYSDIEDALINIRRNMNIFDISDRDRLFSEFNRYKLAMPDYHATKLVPYIFFTKPMLEMVTGGGDLKQPLAKDPLWKSLYRDEPKLFTGLDSSYSRDGHVFNALLSNSAMSFQASDEVLKTVEHGETYTGWKMVYGRHTNESNTAGQFSIQYVDDHNFNIYKMHKIWIEYINKVYRGEIDVDRNHIFKKVLTYPCSLYYIVCAADGETILYWSKYFGVFPVNTPASVSSWTHGSYHGLPEFSVNYVYSIKEDFHPVSLNEFNMQSERDLIYRKAYDPTLMTNTRSMVGAPFIEYANHASGKKVYKLRFRD